jgi:hypothetical protein
LPPGIGIIVDPEGRGLNFSLSKESAVAADPPAGGFDDKTFLSSGSLGILQPRLTWRLTFSTPGHVQLRLHDPCAGGGGGCDHGAVMGVPSKVPRLWPLWALALGRRQ